MDKNLLELTFSMSAVPKCMVSKTNGVKGSSIPPSLILLSVITATALHTELIRANGYCGTALHKYYQLLPAHLVSSVLRSLHYNYCPCVIRVSSLHTH